MRVKRKIIEIDEERCDGCGQCILACAEGALALVDGKAKVISDNLCDGLGACIGECPADALKIIERDADEFDESAVETHLETKKDAPKQPAPALACGCPSSQVQIFARGQAQAAPAAGDIDAGEAASGLSHWPVQMRLVPPTAPFLRGADLLVLADCVPVAFPTLHRDFLEGKAVVMGCPKFDDVEQYVDKFAEIFKTAGIKSVTAVVMEVPCCSGLPRIVEMGMKQAGVSFPFERVVISTKGKILRRVRG